MVVLCKTCEVFQASAQKNAKSQTFGKQTTILQKSTNVRRKAKQVRRPTGTFFSDEPVVEFTAWALQPDPKRFAYDHMHPGFALCFKS